MPISSQAIKEARELIKSGSVFCFNGRTAHDEAGLQVIINAEGEADSSSVSIDLADLERERERADILRERSELEAEKVRLADDRKAFEAEKEAWLESRNNESVIPLKVIYEAETLEEMSHEDLGRLCGTWDIHPVPAKKVERIAAVIEAQEKHEAEEAKRNFWHDGDPNEGS